MLWFETSGLQNWKRIHFSCFKPPVLWVFCSSSPSKLSFPTCLKGSKCYISSKWVILSLPLRQWRNSTLEILINSQLIGWNNVKLYWHHLHSVPRSSHKHSLVTARLWALSCGNMLSPSQLSHKTWLGRALHSAQFHRLKMASYGHTSGF